MNKEKEVLSRRTFLRLAALVGTVAAIDGISCYGGKIDLKISDKDIKLLPASAAYPSPYPDDNLIPELKFTSGPPLKMWDL